MYEIITECFRPYEGSLKKQNKKGTNIDFYVAKDPNFRPEIDEVNFKEFEWCIELTKRCWNHNPTERPPFSEIVKILKSKQIL
jgi:hypothetical protein